MSADVDQSDVQMWPGVFGPGRAVGQAATLQGVWRTDDGPRSATRSHRRCEPSRHHRPYPPRTGQRSAPRPQATGTVRRLQSDVLQKEIAGGKAIASNPCCSTLDFFQYFLCRPFLLLTAVNITAFGVAVAIAFGNPVPVLPALGWAVYNAWRHTRLARSVVVKGDVNPGIIISKNPWRVAVYGDLSTGFEGPRPAIKVLMAALTWMPNGPPEIGKRDFRPLDLHARAGPLRVDVVFFPFRWRR